VQTSAANRVKGFQTALSLLLVTSAISPEPASVFAGGGPLCSGGGFLWSVNKLTNRLAAAMYIVTRISCVNASANTADTIRCCCGVNEAMCSGDLSSADIWSEVKALASACECLILLLETITAAARPTLPPSDRICVSAPCVTAIRWDQLGFFDDMRVWAYQSTSVRLESAP